MEWHKPNQKMEKIMRKGTKVIMTEDSVQHYGEEYRDAILIITHVAHSVEEHPGYDMGVYPEGLYDLKRKDTGEELGMSLYDWELQPENYTGDKKMQKDTMEELQEPVDYKTACEHAQKLANHLRRKTVVIWESSGKFMVYGRMEFMNSQPSNPRERQRVFEEFKPE